MDASVYVISDLHLGGADASPGHPAFQMCSQPSQELLASWIEALAQRVDSMPTHLVINGDLVDFLAEEPFEAFTTDESRAVDKLDEILRRTAPIWTALSGFASRPRARLSILLGNHDVELSFPRVRRRLLEAVSHTGGATAAIEFSYDNEALNIGTVLIEHGNRFDAWNAVHHDSLRQFRSQLSRGLSGDRTFLVPPGSNMVEKVINPIKRHYPFVDLLKPEESSLLPVLAALGIGTTLSNAIEFAQRFRQQSKLSYTDDAEPAIPGFVAATSATSDQELTNIALARAMLDGSTSGNVAGLRSTVAGLQDYMAVQLRNARRESLYLAFQKLRQQRQDDFDVGKERPKYLGPATAAIGRGFDVVAYGHTHFAKNIEIPSPHGSVPARYLNSGTWADLMWIPSSVWSDNRDTGRTALLDFVADLEQGRLGRWRKALPTYLRIEIRADRVVDAGAFFADDNEPVSTEEIARRMDA